MLPAPVSPSTLCGPSPPLLLHAKLLFHRPLTHSPRSRSAAKSYIHCTRTIHFFPYQLSNFRPCSFVATDAHYMTWTERHRNPRFFPPLFAHHSPPPRPMFPMFILAPPLLPRPPRNPSNSRRSRWQSALIAVAGATSGVGSLIVSKLLSSPSPPVHDRSDQSAAPPGVTTVRALVRSVEKARKRFPQTKQLQLVHVPSTFTASADVLRTALRDVDVLIICTGTTAFPTRAWRGGNNPQNVDDRGVRALVEAVDASMSRVVLLSSIGTCRSAQFPFFILNAFGVLDAKRKGEINVIRAARSESFSYAIVRLGRLIGPPHSNMGMLRSNPHPNRRDVVVARGDTLTGELSRDAAAEAVVVVAGWDVNSDFDISLVHTKGGMPRVERWMNLFREVETIQ